mmetsp:Transcript_20783/g.43663  ORF Transcript_20783/g.43663 Transcript_20783/m.43663 type:complete len:93 (-) Transcript_20783:20-298(-)
MSRHAYGSCSCTEKPSLVKEGKFHRLITSRLIFWDDDGDSLPDRSGQSAWDRLKIAKWRPRKREGTRKCNALSNELEASGDASRYHSWFNQH